MQVTVAGLPPHPVLDAWYGDAARRAGFVRTPFDQNADGYDRTNRLFSLNTGSHCRAHLLRRTGLRTGDKVLDVATRIGLVAREARRLTRPDGLMIGLDISAGMLAVARRQAGLALVQANAEMLPIADGGFDMVTMGYALRHVGDLAGAFSDFHRVLRPGSVLVEIARPRSRTGHRLAWLYLKHSLPLASRLHLHGETSRLPPQTSNPVMRQNLLRRCCLPMLGLALLGLALIRGLPGTMRVAWAADQVPVEVVITSRDPVALFIGDVGRQLPQVMGSAPTMADKRRRLTPFLTQVVDVEALSRFCLGRYWAMATPEQRGRYQALFLKSIVNNIAGRMTTYSGGAGHVVVQAPVPHPDGIYVPTLVKGATTPEVHVDWVVEADRRPMRIVDVVAEGMSLRLAKRSDFVAYLSHHDGDIAAFLDALERQTAR